MYKFPIYSISIYIIKFNVEYCIEIYTRIKVTLILRYYLLYHFGQVYKRSLNRIVAYSNIVWNCNLQDIVSEFNFNKIVIVFTALYNRILFQCNIGH